MAEKGVITQKGTGEEFDIQVAQRVLPYIPFMQLGYNGDVDASVETLSGGTAYQSSASVIKISSDSANDASAGTGMRTLLLEGLDGSYNQISETITLNGQTAVNSTGSYLRVSKMTGLTFGSGGQNAGVVYAGTGTVTSGVPAVILMRIAATFNISHEAIYTVPANYKGYIRRVIVDASGVGAAEYVYATLVTKTNGGGWVSRMGVLRSSTGYPVIFEPITPIAVASQTDIEVRVQGSGAINAVVYGSLEGIIVPSA